MQMSHFSLSIRNRKALIAAVLCASLSLVITGCGIGGAAPAGNGLGNLGSISGTVYGGHQPIGGSTVKLYAAGTTGYGQGATLLAQTTSNYQGDGRFAFTQVVTQPGSLSANYACPSPTSEIYITITGGDPTGGDTTAQTNPNPAINLLAGIGQCSTVGSLFVNVNEPMTVASVWALQQYINPVTSSGVIIGTSSSAQGLTGLQNAFAMIPNLVPYNVNGAPNTTFTQTGTASTVSGLTVTATPEAGKIAFLADILASCVQNFSGACTTLFTAAPPPAAARTSQPSGTWNTATDTLGVALYMATNPTGAGLQVTAGNCAFTPSPTSNLNCLDNAPTAAGSPFTTSVTAPSDFTLGVNYATSTSATCSGTGSPGTFMFYNYQLAVDASGNVWAASDRAVSATNANVSEISPVGQPLACVGAGATVPFTGLINGLTIDTTGNIWASQSASGGPIDEINPTSLAITNWGESGITPVTAGLVADGSGNIFYGVSAAAMRKFTGAATASSAAASTAVGTAFATNANGYYVAADPAGRIWAAQVGGPNLYEVYPGGTSPVGGYSTFSAFSTTSPQAQIAIDGSNKVWYTNTSSTNSTVAVTPNATDGSAGTAASTTTGGGQNGDRGVAIDGAGNAWVANNATGVVSEITNAGVAITPSTGYVKTSSPSTLRAVAVDPSGNVWIGTNATTVANITEIIGAAVPVVTPLSIGAKNSTLGTKP